MSRQNGSKFEGVCKWWDAVKGCGFLLANDGGADLFASQFEINNGGDGFRALVPGQPVECIYTEQQGQKPIAKSITAPGGGPLPSFKDKFCAKKAILAAKPRDPNMLGGTVKWFDTSKSFGFIVPEAGGEDIFFHYSECNSVIPEAGDNVEYKLKEDTKNNKMIGSKVVNKTRKRSNPQYSTPQVIPQVIGGFPQQQGVTGVRKTGVCKFFDEGKGYGFIVPDFGGPDIHVHKSGIMGAVLEKDEAVEYEEEFNGRRLKATMVRKINKQVGTGTKRAAPGGMYGQQKQQRVQYEQVDYVQPEQQTVYYSTNGQQQQQYY